MTPRARDLEISPDDQRSTGSFDGIASSPEKETRLAVIVSHPIQHFAPWHRELAKLPGIRLKVFFGVNWGAESYFDQEFGTEVKWDIPLLEGYDSAVLPLRRKIDEIGFWELDNPTIGKALTEFRPNVVQLFGYVHRTNWRARAWCNRNDVPVLLYSDSNASAANPPFLKRVVKDTVVRWFYKGVSGALFTGDNNREYHKRYGLTDDRLFQGSLPIDERMLLSSTGDLATARNEIRRQYGIPDDAFVIVISGKLSERKSPMHLTEAVAVCREKGQPVWALVVGEGDQRPKLEKFIADRQLKNVILTGFVNQRSIGKYYAASDVLVSTSAHDPHPLIVPESGCFGLPVIVSDRLGCIGKTDTARVGENALVFPWGNIDALADCILKLRNDRALLQRMSRAAKEIADSQDVTVAARQLKDAAEKLKKAGVR